MGTALRYGVVLPNGGATIGRVAGQLRHAEACGLDHAWMPGIPNGPDVITLLAVAGRDTERIEVGSAVVPAYPRHPSALAVQALAAHEALGGRFTLGVGLSHRKVVERLGLAYREPVAYMTDYLAILRPLLRDGEVDHEGPRLRCRLRLDVARPTGTAPPLLLAALGPRMLRLAGEAADGAMTWMAGPRTLEGHVVPRLTAAAREAGRPAPRVLASVPTLLTGASPAAVDAGRDRADAELGTYGRLPAYQAVLAREGATRVADVALVGDEAALAAGIARLRDAGVTDLQVTPFGDADDIDRTVEFVASRPVG
jgi:F420-dependent oxidoreductase-like protein